jgi:membrane protein implicated in regulation of membrane protease activity
MKEVKWFIILVFSTLFLAVGVIGLVSGVSISFSVKTLSLIIVVVGAIVMVYVYWRWIDARENKE